MIDSSQDIREKLLIGMKASIQKLIERKKQNKGYFVVLIEGKIVKLTPEEFEKTISK